MFIPHLHMCVNDNYSILNYRTDNALSFANYILEENLLIDKKMAICISKRNDIDLLKQYISSRFPNPKLKFVYGFSENSKGKSLINFKEKFDFYFTLAQSSHVFTSQTHRYRPLARSSKIKMIDLNYYVAPIKSSTYDTKSSLYHTYQSLTKKDYDYFIVTSEVAKRLIIPSYSFGYEQFLILGMCRNDYLFSNESPVGLKEKLLKDIHYNVKKIVLYIPTHRDNLSTVSQFDTAKNLFGFRTDLEKLDAFFQKAGIYMICKIHPKQHSLIDSNDLPSSISLFNPNKYYGLAEIMKISDVLMTDYTSGYFDYLILDKPVIFNFSDIDNYSTSRGLVFSPIDAICAGDIIHNEKEFLEAISNVELDRHKEKRKTVRDLFFSDQDANSCKRVYEYFFC